MFQPCLNHGLSTVSQTIMGADLEGTTASPRHPSLMSLLPHLKKTANTFTVVWKIVSFGIKFKELENQSYSKTYYWEPAERDKDLQGEEAAISGQDPWGLHQTPWQRKGMRWVYSETPWHCGDKFPCILTPCYCAAITPVTQLCVRAFFPFIQV